MRNLILMALDKAKRLSDEQLAEEIAQLEAGKRNLRMSFEDGRIWPLNAIVVNVLRQVLEERRK